MKLLLLAVTFLIAFFGAVSQLDRIEQKIDKLQMCVDHMANPSNSATTACTP